MPSTRRDAAGTTCAGPAPHLGGCVPVPGDPPGRSGSAASGTLITSVPWTSHRASESATPRRRRTCRAGDAYVLADVVARERLEGRPGPSRTTWVTLGCDLELVVLEHANLLGGLDHPHVAVVVEREPWDRVGRHVRPGERAVRLEHLGSADRVAPERPHPVAREAAAAGRDEGRISVVTRVVSGSTPLMIPSSVYTHRDRPRRRARVPRC